ncbi:Mu transposase domain-containing protein [Enterococcus sp. LJL98]
MKINNWLTAHIHTLEFFQGVPETIVSDNLKTGVTKTDYSEPLLNEGYRQISDYYRFTIVSARVRSPKDKPSVEGNVGFISRQVIAAFRSKTFFSLNELNQEIFEKTQELNREAFQKRPGSRYTVFQEEELPFLSSLRHPRFTQSQWRISKVQLDYHIQIDRMFYSVPYEYVNSEVEVRITDNLIEVYFNEHRIASHKRLRGDIGQYATIVDHMPDNHRRYLNHTPKENLLWAEEIGTNTYAYVDYILSNNVEKKALKLLATLRNIASKYSIEELEAGCHTLISIAKEPTNSLLKSILSRAKKRNKTLDARLVESIIEEQTDSNFGFVRGASYFGGKRNEK